MELMQMRKQAAQRKKQAAQEEAGTRRTKSPRAASSALPVVHYTRQRCSPARARPATIPGALQTSRDAGPDASNPVLAAFRVRELSLAEVAEK